MKRNIIKILAIGLYLFSSCNEEKVTAPFLEVSTPKTSYSVNDTVWFNLNGNPDIITFYSGENGKNYDHIDRIQVDGTPILKFTSQAANGAQANSLHLMVSNDFEGVVSGSDSLSLINIQAANWTDISDRATLSTGSAVASGDIDLSDFAKQKKPIYIAFKYTAESGSIQRKWTISSLTVSNNLPDGSSYTLANLTSTAINNYGNSNILSPGWLQYISQNTYKWSVGTTLVITGATTAAAATAPAESWVLTGPIDLSKVCPDLGTFIKGMDVKVPDYFYVYKNAGTYTATFIGSVDNAFGEEHTIRELTLTIGAN